ncbi:hypothetical protein Asppvi_009385 [Aspergillus pseudoviridinutans]|uniref:ABM domain-containing protein n=1 Tax=Aspergillus pseudoviridinutans TaxID=1517512 RepID=A0A9P3EW56_9EURO|nr:uncharacterized protein Asppvi_009385 [Aspergillus pseudoviridinutans]GIJ90431.1 hypothetical protein Asppvi_009385 [Aspergillus pseudoviridinutans]
MSENLQFFTDLDPENPFTKQVQQTRGPVTLVNTFIVPQGKMDEFLRVWKDDAAFMKAQPGFLSAQLYRGVESNVIINVANWETSANLANAVLSSYFQENLKRYPEGLKICPQLLEKMAIPNLCTA